MMPSRWRGPISDSFSEFTYAFALVNELITLGNPPIVSVPVFPSLIEEGRATGGYDVKLDRPGQPLFLQFKLAKQIRGRRAREFRQQIFWSPFYRMYIRARRSSRQHELLLELEQSNLGNVYYCAPAFHTLWELNRFYEERRIAQYTRFVKPTELPAISDDEEHWLSFREARSGTVAFFSAEGKMVEVDERPILTRLSDDLEHAAARPLGDAIERLAEWMTEAIGRPAQLLPEVGRISNYRAALARAALLSYTVLNSALCVLQSRSREETG
jgi:hypothetical protein